MHNLGTCVVPNRSRCSPFCSPHLALLVCSLSFSLTFSLVLLSRSFSVGLVLLAQLLLVRAQ